MTQAQGPQTVGGVAERWQRLLTLFESARALDRCEQQEFIERECRDDSTLAAELRRLLRADRDPSPLLARVPGAHDRSSGAAAGNPVDHDPYVDAQIGDYRIVRVVGEGGMGVVYAAEQTRPVKRQVAVKLIRPGLDTRRVLQRFDLERQALAMMDHPNVATAFGAGATPEQRPYVVLEFVDGEPITIYCDAKRLSTRARLELFLRVAGGVEHAHQRGIIHRDLKPSNLLVAEKDGVAVPKIIDFGIARAIDQSLVDGHDKTALGAWLGTPEYMSPEQAWATDPGVDTRSDVYSLGVVLYELLVGALPLVASGPPEERLAEMRRRLRDEPTVPPSRRLRTMPHSSVADVAAERRCDPASLRRQLAGDLDWIVLKALAKEPENRYGSVRELANDVVRYLGNRPVQARAPTWSYRAQKFFERHRIGVSVAALCLLLLIGVTTVLGVLSSRLSDALEVAETEREQADEVTELLLDAFGSANPFGRQRSAEEVTARDILERGLARIDSRGAGSPEVEARLLGSMGRAFKGLGELDQAASALERALQLHRRQADSQHLAESLLDLAELRLEQSRLDEAGQLIGQASDLVTTDGPPSLRARLALVRGSWLHRVERIDEAERDLITGLETERGLNQGQGSLLEASFLDGLAEVASARGDYDSAVQWIRSATDVRREVDSQHPSQLVALSNLGWTLHEMGRGEEGRDPLEETASLAAGLLGEDHPETLRAQGRLAFVLNTLGEGPRALEIYEELLARMRATVGDTHLDVAVTLNNLSLVYQGLGRASDAEQALREALEIQYQLVGRDHGNVAYHLANLGRVLYELGRIDEAEGSYRESLRIRQEHFDAGHPLIADTKTWLGALLTDTNRAATALPLLTESVAIREATHGAGDWRTAEARSLLAVCRLELGRPDGTLSVLEASYQLIRQQRGDGWLRTGWAADRLVRYHESRGNSVEAARWRRLRAERHG